MENIGSTSNQKSVSSIPKKYDLWRIVSKMKPYLKAEKLEERVLIILAAKSIKFSALQEGGLTSEMEIKVSDSMGKNATFNFAGTIKDRTFKQYKLEIRKLQVFEIPIWKYLFLNIIHRRVPMLVESVYLDGENIWNGKKINWPKGFVH